MVKMDEYFLHSYYLVCGTDRELWRRLSGEGMESRLKMILEGKRFTTASDIFLGTLYRNYIINSYNQCHPCLVVIIKQGLPFKCFPSIQLHFRLHPRNTPSSIFEPSALLLPRSSRSQRMLLFGGAMILQWLRYTGYSVHTKKRRVRLTDGRFPDSHSTQAMVDSTSNKRRDRVCIRWWLMLRASCKLDRILCDINQGLDC